jgi:hypothetical protein
MIRLLLAACCIAIASSVCLSGELTDYSPIKKDFPYQDNSSVNFVRGAVLNQEGGAASDLRIRITNSESKIPFSVSTDTNGIYYIPAVSSNVKRPYVIEVHWGSHLVYRDFIVRLGQQPDIELGKTTSRVQDSSEIGPGVQSGSSAAVMSSYCEFTTGPIAGSTLNYSSQPAAAIGSPCSDGAGSTGNIVPAGKAGSGDKNSGGLVSALQIALRHYQEKHYFFVSPNLPNDGRLRHAYDEFHVPAADRDKAIAFFDATVFHGGGLGMIFTDRGIYYHSTLNRNGAPRRGFIAYGELPFREIKKIDYAEISLGHHQTFVVAGSELSANKLVEILSEITRIVKSQ